MQNDYGEEAGFETPTEAIDTFLDIPANRMAVPGQPSEGRLLDDNRYEWPLLNEAGEQVGTLWAERLTGGWVRSSGEWTTCP